MPHTITQNSSTLSNSLSVPSDGIDPVNEASVDPVFQNVLNNTYYLAYTQVFTRPRLEMIESDSGTRILIYPFSGLWVSTNNVAPEIANWISLNLTGSGVYISAANLSPPGFFAANTAYYVYCYASGSPAVPAFEISATAPEITNTFKDSYITRRYIGSFITDATAPPATKIVPFRMVNSEYFLKDSPGIIAGPTTTTSMTTVQVKGGGFYYPQTARVLKLRPRITNDGHTTNGGAATVTFYPGSLPSNVVTVDFPFTYPATTSTTVSLEIPISHDVNIVVGIASDTFTSISVDNIAVGYKE